MKKIIYVIIAMIFLVGCGKKNFTKQYEDMKIGNIDSYQLDLRIYSKENKMLKIDNYKNKEYKVVTNDSTYYVVDNITYKETDTNSYEKVEEKIFTNTDILLDCLNNIKSRKEISNDIEGLELKVYEVEVKDKYVKELLKELGLNEDYKEISSKVYLQDDKIYKIEHKIDNTKITATFFRVNNIKPLNINFNK